MSSSMQNLLIFLGLIALAAFAYYMLVIQGNSDLDTSMSESTSIESQLFLQQINQLKSVSIDAALFSEAAFQNLQDQSAPVESQPVGRANPFTNSN